MGGSSDRLQRLGYERHGTGETSRDAAYQKAKQARREGKTTVVDFNYGSGTYVVWAKNRKSSGRTQREPKISRRGVFPLSR